MLNEKLEYSLYLTKGYGGLIREDNLKDSLKGLRHILTVLARGFLDACRAEEITDIDTLSRYTIAFLKFWLIGGYVSELKDDAEATIKELSKYPGLEKQIALAEKATLLSHLVGVLDKKTFPNEESVKKMLKGKIMGWDRYMFENTDESSFNTIYFKAILSDALFKGPLTNSVLLLKNDDTRFFGLFGDFGYNKNASSSDCIKKHYHYNDYNKIRKERISLIMAVVAMYLQRKPRNCSYVHVVIADLSNYMGKRCNKCSSKPFESVVPFMEKSNYNYLGQELFSLMRLKRIFVKLAVNYTWLKDYDVHLAPADQPVPEGYVAYDDTQLCGIYKNKA